MLKVVNKGMKTFKVVCSACKGIDIHSMNEDEINDTITLYCTTCGNLEVLECQ